MPLYLGHIAVPKPVPLYLGHSKVREYLNLPFKPPALVFRNAVEGLMGEQMTPYVVPLALYGANGGTNDTICGTASTLWG